ncbi:MAG TPA: hypothetical protein VF092_13095 [Longimicrobium sp.]
MSIHLSPELESRLAEEAEARGTTPDLLAEQVLRKHLPAGPDPEVEPGKSLADRLKDFIGVLHSSEHVPGGARMSERTGEQFAAGMLEKRAQGRL